MTHRYESWELFGRFLIKHYASLGAEIDGFIYHWDMGDWDILDRDWPEWSQFVANQA